MAGRLTTSPPRCRHRPPTVRAPPAQMREYRDETLAIKWELEEENEELRQELAISRAETKVLADVLSRKEE